MSTLQIIALIASILYFLSGLLYLRIAIWAEGVGKGVASALTSCVYTAFGWQIQKKEEEKKRLVTLRDFWLTFFLAN